MKKILVIVVAVLMMAMVFSGCASEKDETVKVGMVTDSGTITDKSFNQGTYDGVRKAAEELGLEYRYLKPTGETKADYLREIANLYDAGYKVIVTPGNKFESAIYEAQSKYKDAKFVILDGEPNPDNPAETKIGDNTVSIFFNEHEAGFVGGVAAAVQLKEGEIGFIGGEPIAPVQKFNWGFQQGVAYANANYGTNCVMSAENVIYQGTFSEVEAGQQLGAAMFDKGVRAIFCAAGGVGVGAINEAKTRAAAGEDVWIIGVDVDQYEDGVYEDGKSVILTSAMKDIVGASYSMIIANSKGEFPGGQKLLMGGGLPSENPNLGEDAVNAVDEVKEKMAAGEITVSDVQGDLFP